MNNFFLLLLDLLDLLDAFFLLFETGLHDHG
jgi:hypothetical protein